MVDLTSLPIPARLANALVGYTVYREDTPDEALLEFLRSTFDAAATLGDWDLSEYRRRHFPHGE